jgi:cytochrome c biogenesis protein CcmG, thiol:disulfide interchange protein DsbE
MIRWTTTILLPLAFLFCACEVPRGGPVRVGGAAPEYAARTLDGDPQSLKDLRGSPVLLNVWATWCHPCREEIPALQELHTAFAPRGLKVIGVSIDQGGQEKGIRDFMADFRATYPVWLDPDGDVQTVFSTIGVPSTYLIGPGGEVLWTHVGPVRADDPQLRRLIEESLPAAS